MTNRMQNWTTLFALLGWLCNIGGVIGAFFTYGATLVIVIVGMSLLFTAAVLNWMDGVLDHLQSIRVNQQTIAEHLYQIEHSQKETARNMPQADAPARSDGEPRTDSPSQVQPGEYNAQHEADIYRLSRNLRK